MDQTFLLSLPFTLSLSVPLSFTPNHRVSQHKDCLYTVLNEKLHSTEIFTCPDLGLAAQIMLRSGSSLSLLQMITIKRYIQNFGLYLAILFRKKKKCRICAHLMLATRSVSRPKSHRLDFFEYFLSHPLSETVRDKTL